MHCTANLASLWQSKTYFYPMSMSLVNDITVLWLWPRLGVTRTSPVSTELVAGKEERLEMPWRNYCTTVNRPQLNCWPVSWTFLWLGFSYVPLPLRFYPVFSSVHLHCHDGYIRKPSKTFGYVRGQHQNSRGRQYVLVDIWSLSKVTLSIIFTKSYNSGTLLHDWISANVTPIHKKGAWNLVSNYRPVNLRSG